MELSTVEGDLRCFVYDNFGEGLIGIELCSNTLHSHQTMLGLVSLKELKAAIEDKESFDG